MAYSCTIDSERSFLERILQVWFLVSYMPCKKGKDSFNNPQRSAIDTTHIFETNQLRIFAARIPVEKPEKVAISTLLLPFPCSFCDVRSEVLAQSDVARSLKSHLKFFLAFSFSPFVYRAQADV